MLFLVLERIHALEPLGAPQLRGGVNGYVPNVYAAIVHDIYQMIFNGKDFKQTWIGKFLDGFGLVDKMFSVTDKLADAWVDFKGANGGNLLASSANLLLGMPVDASQPPTSLGSSSSSNQYSVEAPITVNVPPGTDPRKVGEHVALGVREHLNQVYRETQRSTKPVVAY